MTELIWENKFKIPFAGNVGNQKTSPIRIPLPFQTIETINKPRKDGKQYNVFEEETQPEWYNRLIWGDKKYVLPSLLEEFAGKVNLIYIDPPFDTGANFSFTTVIPPDPTKDIDENLLLTKQPNVIEQKAYRDTWGKGLNSYLQWFYETAILLRELLAENGSIYVHLDWHVGHYAKVILDEVFGYENFRNEIVWKRSANTSSIGKIYKRSHDLLLFYSRSQEYKFAFQYKELSETSKNLYSNRDERGFYQLVPILVSGKRMGKTGEIWKNVDPNKRGKDGMHWVTIPEKLEEYFNHGLIVFPEKQNGIPRLKYYLEDNKGVVLSDIWEDINLISSGGKESVGYPTQKPEALLERIIKASSNEGDLVFDCFAGSGTTAAVAERLGRRWITGDLGRFAIHTTRKRLLGIKNVKPFMVQNLGKYERQQWMKAQFEDTESRIVVEQAYRKFILDLYRAEPVNGYTWLHGIRNGRMIHIGNVDAPVSDGDVKAIVKEFWKAVGKSGAMVNGLDILGWDFSFELNQTAKQYAASNNVNLRFPKIPNEVLEKKAVEQGDIQFFELAYLEVDTCIKNQILTLELSDLIIPSDDIPMEVRSKITHWSQWIDYWAVDWEFRDDTFHNQWQSYRTRKDPKLDLKVSHNYETAGTYTVMVKIIDILGNDTTKMLTINIEDEAQRKQYDESEVRKDTSKRRSSVSGIY